MRSKLHPTKSYLGASYTQWLISTRLNASLLLLESSELSVGAISAQTGFSSEQIFRKHFKKMFDTTPQAWRKLFKQVN